MTLSIVFLLKFILPNLFIMDPLIKNVLYIISYFLIGLGSFRLLQGAYETFNNGHYGGNGDNYLGVIGLMVLSAGIVAIITHVVRYNLRLIFAGFVPIFSSILYSLAIGHPIVAAIGLIAAAFMFRAEFGYRIGIIGFRHCFDRKYIEKWEQDRIEEGKYNGPVDQKFTYDYSPSSHQNSGSQTQMGWVHGKGYVEIKNDGVTCKDYSGQSLTRSPFGGYDTKK